MRVQVALNVNDLEEAVDYYTRLLGAPPAKRKPGYANFALDSPPLKLVLFHQPGAERLNHLGIELFDESDVESAAQRIEQAELPHEVIMDETCCYARKSTVYSTDPQGLLWEYYLKKDDWEPERAEGERSEAPGCC
jgi:catechol 2,3-dioxygenase-like lactoylglutathione lyase family enzyme